MAIVGISTRTGSAGQVILQSLKLNKFEGDIHLVGRSAEVPIPFIWVGTALPAFWSSGHTTSSSPIHIGFSAANRVAVDAFYKAAMAAGGRDNGAPGPRGPKEMKYYGADVLDPDGNNIEAGVRE